jgi:mannitol/fructose-specific phosphotransferase system IIA component (Ntr-type)
MVNVPDGVKMRTPDERPVHLVFLVLSPRGGAQTHLASLAALAKLAQDEAFLALMKRQRVPERLARLIVERG